MTTEGCGWPHAGNWTLSGSILGFCILRWVQRPPHVVKTASVHRYSTSPHLRLRIIISLCSKPQNSTKVFFTTYFLLLKDTCSSAALIGSPGSDCCRPNCRRYLLDMYPSTISKKGFILCHIEIQTLSIPAWLYCNHRTSSAIMKSSRIRYYINS